MVADRADSFLDNWTYLKAELNWLERLLLLAVAQQRKETKTIDRVAQTKADRATSHWWKGMVSLEGGAFYDSPQPSRQSESGAGVPPTFQQQLEAKVRNSQNHGIRLALPSLCDRFSLKSFEKNVILLALAPEVHRRYGQLYSFLQSGNELPTLDLALRSFCRNDTEWRAARSQLTEASPLRKHGLIEILPSSVPLLQRSFKLSDELVNSLLCDVPKDSEVYDRIPPVSFADLVLPEALLDRLQHLSDRVQFGALVDETCKFSTSPGSFALFVGPSGTGKTMSANAIANRLQSAIVEIDVATIDPANYSKTLQDLIAKAPIVLLIRSAELWLRQDAPMLPSEVARFIQARRSIGSLTFFSVHHHLAMSSQWRSALSERFVFPKPNPAARVQLWQRALANVKLDAAIDWEKLAKRSISGGEIEAIARSAVIDAMANGGAIVFMDHLLKALKYSG